MCIKGSFMNKKETKKRAPTIENMTDADLKKVLKTVERSVSESLSRSKRAHQNRLSQIKPHHANR